MFKAIVQVAFGSGAALGHQYWGGRGVAFSKSPKRALAQARRLAIRQAGEGANWMSIMDGALLINLQTGKTIDICDGYWITK